MTVFAAALAGLAAALAVGSRPNLLRSRLASRHRPVGVGGRGSTFGGKVEGHGVGSDRIGRRVVVATVGGGVVGLGLGGPALAALGSVAAGVLAAAHARTVAARGRREREAGVGEACMVLAAELRSGVHPRQALAAVAAEWPALFGAAAGQAAVGGDVCVALRAAVGPGTSALSVVAAGWEVSERTGAALSDVLTAVADSLRADATSRREAEAQLSTLRVTARLLAVLPVGTLLVLSGGGSAPMHFLFRSPYGLACLTGATVLVACGLWWVDRLVRSATRSSWSS